MKKVNRENIRTYHPVWINRLQSVVNQVKEWLSRVFLLKLYNFDTTIYKVLTHISDNIDNTVSIEETSSKLKIDKERVRDIFQRLYHTGMVYGIWDNQYIQGRDNFIGVATYRNYIGILNK